MSQAISWRRGAFFAHIAFALVAYVCCTFPYAALAQIAPTNSATVAGNVCDSTGKPVAGATVSLSGQTNFSTPTNARGDFVFVGVPFGPYQLTAASQNLGTVTRSLAVQGDTNVAIQYNAAPGIKTIARVNTASSATFNVTSASITQVSPMQSAFAGVTSWRTILEQIPGVSVGGTGPGTSAFAGIPNSPLTPLVISIDGALPYETATLLDDMPLIGGNTFAVGSPGIGTEMSTYPLNGFDTGDIVRGPGANAPSIVNSIGGSLVLHSPGVVTKSQFALSLSTDPFGGIVTNLLGAVHWKNLSATFTYGINDSPGPNSQPGFPAEFEAAPRMVNGEGFALYSFPGTLNAPFSPALYNFYGFTNSLQICCIDTTTPWNVHSGSLSLFYTFSPRLTAEINYSGEKNTGQPPGQEWASEYDPPAGYSGPLAPGIYNFPYGIGTLRLSPFSASAASSVTEEKIVALIGRGSLKLAALQNRSFASNGLFTPPTMTAQLYGAGYTCSNTSIPCLFGNAASNPTYTLTFFNGNTYNLTLNSIRELSLNEVNNRDLLLNYTTAIGDDAHAGVSFVQSYYDNPCAVTFSEQSFSETISNPAAESQTTDELRVFAGGNPTTKTTLDLSGYFVYANYHTLAFGNPNAWQNLGYRYAAPRLGFVWRPQASVTVRLAAGGGFSQAPLVDVIPEGPQYDGSFYVGNVPNPNLQPEKSFAFDLGSDLRLRQNTMLSFDLYRADLRGQIYMSTQFSGTFDGVFGTLPFQQTSYGNLGTSRYEGLLFEIRHDLSHGIYWAFSGGLTRGYIVSLPPGFYNAPGETCNFKTNIYTDCVNLNLVPGINFNGSNLAGAGVSGAASIPYAQGLSTVGYRWTSEKYVELNATYYGNNNSFYRPAFVALDGRIGYPLTKNISATLTLNNITGMYDAPIQTMSLSSMLGAPVIAGLPYSLFGENYGVRSAILTTNIRF